MNDQPAGGCLTNAAVLLLFSLASIALGWWLLTTRWLAAPWR